MSSRDLYEKSFAHFLAPIEPLRADAGVSEILVNGPDAIYCEREGRLERTHYRFRDAQALMAAARHVSEYVNRPLGEDHHSLDGRVPDGSRVHVVIPPCSRSGVCLSIRKFNRAIS